MRLSSGDSSDAVEKKAQPAPPRRYFQTRYDNGDVRPNSGYTLGEAFGKAVIGGASGVALFMFVRFKVSNPAQMIVRTGLGIRNVTVTKTAVQWPFQRTFKMSLRPHTYEFKLGAMSKEKMEFILPGVFTIGPATDEASLTRYATLLTSNDDEDNSVANDDGDSTKSRFLGGSVTQSRADEIYLNNLIKGVIEGETRVRAAALDIEQIFESRDQFRLHIIETVKIELGKFGLEIYNANIKELEDAPGSEYFVHARQRKRADAENTARKDIADAKFRGDVAVAEKESDTRVQRAQFESSAVLAENMRQVEMAKSTSEKDIAEADYTRRAQVAQIEAQKAAQIREMELQRELDQHSIQQQLEKQRSSVVVKATVDAEAMQRLADATLYRATTEAQAVRLKYDAQADGLRNLLACSDPSTVLQVCAKLASVNASMLTPTPTPSTR